MRALLIASIAALTSGCLVDYRESRYEGVSLDRAPQEEPDVGREPDAEELDASMPDAAPCVEEPPACTEADQTVCDGAQIRACQIDDKGCFFLRASGAIDCAASGQFCVAQGKSAACQQSPCAAGTSFHCPDPTGAPQVVGRCTIDGAPSGVVDCPDDQKCDPSAETGCSQDAPACRGIEAGELACDRAVGEASRVRCEPREGAAVLEAIEDPCEQGSVCFEGDCEPNECDQPAETQCAETESPYDYQVCKKDEVSGRLMWSEAQECTVDQVCVDDACAPDPNSCRAVSAGAAECVGSPPDQTQFRECEQVAGERRVWGPPQGCTPDEVCRGDSGAAACVPSVGPCASSCTEREHLEDRARCGLFDAVESCQKITRRGTTCYQWRFKGVCWFVGATPAYQGCSDASEGVFCEVGACKLYPCKDDTCSGSAACELVAP